MLKALTANPSLSRRADHMKTNVNMRTAHKAAFVDNRRGTQRKSIELCECLVSILRRFPSAGKTLNRVHDRILADYRHRYEEKRRSICRDLFESLFIEAMKSVSLMGSWGELAR